MARVETVAVGSVRAYEATGPDGSVVTVKNLGPDSCVFATASTVSAGSNDGTLASGSSIAFTPSKFFLSSGTSNLQVTSQVGDQFRQYDRDNGQPGIMAPTTPLWGRTVAAIVAGRAYAVRFVPTRRMQITLIAFTVTTFAGSDDACDVGIFNGSLTTLLGSSGATSGKLNATTGVKTVTLASPVTLQPGIPYYAAFSAVTPFGGTAAQLEVTSLTNSATCDLFGSTAGLREQTFGTQHPLSAPFTMGGVISSAPILTLRES